MKKLIPLLLLIMLVCVLCVGCISNGHLAHAADTVSYYEFQVDGANYRLFNTTDNGKITGVYLYEDGLFGASEISVTVEVYSMPQSQFVIDFNIGDSNLSSERLAVRNRLVDLYTEIIRLFTKVNALANTSYDGSASAGGQTSEVYLYNQSAKGTRLEISHETYEMLKIAQEMYLETYGAFNPAVYRLVDLWGFSSRIYSNGNFGLPYDREITAAEFYSNGYPLPDQKYVTAFSAPEFTDFSAEAVVLEDDGAGQYFVTKNVQAAVVDGVSYEQWIDLGGIAKGYAVDKVREMLASRGLTRFYVDAGLSSKSLGWEHDGGKTEMGIQDAFSYFSVLMNLDLAPSSISTSGQYVRKYTVDGVEYSHILDGTTGKPAQTRVKAVTVVVPEGEGEFWGAKGDCLTTALTVMGREKIVKFVNGYLKDHGIKVVVQYETLDGNKQILSNYSKKEVQLSAYAKKEFSWALKSDKDGNFYYDASVVSQNSVYKIVLIVLGSLVGACVIGVVVYHFVRGNKRILRNVQQVKKDKPFKMLDVLVYVCVALLIGVLFFVFVINVEESGLQVINVTDIETGETLFTYNVTYDEYVINTQNLNGWEITVKETKDGMQVTFAREIRGEQRKNVMKIHRGSKPSVVMADSVCGRGKDCVRTFSAVTTSGGVIVCSPNRLKIQTA